jgi:hydroxymethylpyrimidine pyrophosphatase-like HAD family hydrolase
LYGKLRFDETKCDKAVNWLEQLKPEKNNIVTFWENLNIKAQNAAQTQALLQLKNEYCTNKKCLNCEIGFHVLNNN